MKKNIILMLFCFAAQFVTAQVSNVNYALKYNKETCLFDCYLVINEGEAMTLRDRVQLNAQISLIAPAESVVYVEDSYMPLMNNQNLDGEDATFWEVTSAIEAPSAMPTKSIFSISPSLSPTAFYNEMKQGDEVKLFSVKVTPMVDCASDVRIFENGTDPSSSEDGMRGTDFSNGFTIGGIQQKYQANVATVGPSNPTIHNIEVSTSNKIEVSVSASPAEGSSCQRSLTYEFYGPNGLIGNEDALNALNANEIVAGEYKVIVTDNIGCQAEKIFFPRTSETNTTFNSGLSTGTSDLGTETRSVDGTFASSIYPNPSQSMVNVTLEGNAGTKVIGNITDINGAVITTNAINIVMSGSTEEIQIETGLTPVIYNLAITMDEAQTLTHKLLIIK